MAGEGDLLPVSALPVDGTFPTGTAKYEKRAIAQTIPIWDPAICIDCGKCAMVCPHATIRMKVFPTASLEAAPGRLPPQGVPVARAPRPPATIQVAPDDCTGCGVCVDVCPAKSKTDFEPQGHQHGAGRRAPRRRARALGLLPVDPAARSRARSPHDTVKGTQVLEPLFEFSGACAGCGETPYIQLVSQLFGDRMIVANATGCSSIYGGNLPTTPWTVNAAGRGPAWSNSLFEDNAEFGLGMRLALDAQTDQARRLLERLAPEIGDGLARELLDGAAGHRGRDRPSSASGSTGCATRSAGSTARRPPTPDTCWRSPTTSSARASGSSAATAGPTTSASAASTRSCRRAATSTSWSSTPRSTRTPAARPRRPRRAARWPSSRRPARARPRRTSARSPARTATSTSPRSRWAPTTTRRPRRCSRPTPGRARRWSSPTAPASPTASTCRSR